MDSLELKCFRGSIQTFLGRMAAGNLGGSQMGGQKQSPAPRVKPPEVELADSSTPNDVHLENSANFRFACTEDPACILSPRNSYFLRSNEWCPGCSCTSNLRSIALWNTIQNNLERAQCNTDLKCADEWHPKWYLTEVNQSELCSSQLLPQRRKPVDFQK